ENHGIKFWNSLIYAFKRISIACAAAFLVLFLINKNDLINSGQVSLDQYLARTTLAFLEE
ncbi:MAG: hypothetical protein ABIA63_14355, partial [bacterium]